jgi:hypothetical protein
MKVECENKVKCPTGRKMVFGNHILFFSLLFFLFFVFLPFPCSVIRNMFYRFSFLGFVAGRTRGREIERKRTGRKIAGEKLSLSECLDNKREIDAGMESGFVYWGCWDLGTRMRGGGNCVAEFLVMNQYKIASVVDV